MLVHKVRYRVRFLSVVLLCVAGIAVPRIFTLFGTNQNLPDVLPESSPSTEWARLGQGNWSPWFIASDGKVEWAPRESFNDWIGSHDESELIWPKLVDHSYKYYDLRNIDAVFMVPSDGADWDPFSSAYESEQVQVAISELSEILNNGIFGKMMFSHMDDIEKQAKNRYGLALANSSYRKKNADTVQELDYGYMGILRLYIAMVESYGSHALVSGDPEEYIAQLKNQLLLSDLLLEFPCVRSQFLSIDIKMLCLRMMQWGLENHMEKFTIANFKELQIIARDLEQVRYDSVGAAIDSHDIVRHAVGSNGELDSKAFQKTRRGIELVPNFSPSAIPAKNLGSSAKKTLSIANAINATCERLSMSWDNSEFIQLKQHYNKRGESNVKIRELIRMSVPSPKLIVPNTLFIRQNSAAIRLALAIYMYEITFGKYPDESELRDSKFLAAPARDLFGEKMSLRYSQTPSGVLIYSLGPDNDDDNGSAKTLQAFPFAHGTNPFSSNWETMSQIDGDWILFEQRSVR